MSYQEASPEVLKAMIALETSAQRLVSDRKLAELVKIRASQLNGCAYCLDMHTLDARAHGETEQRLNMLAVWWEAEEFYTRRERAALAWTEATTRIPTRGVPDDVYDFARSEFSEAELANLTLLIIAINGWNRLAVGFKSQPGHYKPGKHATANAD